MKRRSALALLGLVAPFAARAQTPGAAKRVAVLMGVSERDAASKARIAAFHQGLEVGSPQSRSAGLEVRWAEGDADRARALARELVELRPDVILGTNTPTMRALKQATQSIPIVFAGLADPISEGIVTNLAKPEGNITGFVSFSAAIAGKWLELLKEVSPAIERATLIYNPDTAPYAIFLPVMEAAAPKLGLTLDRAAVHDRPAIERALSGLPVLPAGGLVVMPDVFTTQHQGLIFELAIRGRVPTVSAVRHYALAGSVVSYGSNFDALYRQAASYVDRILRGESVRDLPVQEPTTYELVLNLKSARARELTLPPSLLARADEVIE